MTTLTSLARAQAVATGMAQPVCTRRHVHLSRVAARWDADKDSFTSYADWLRDDGPPQARRDAAVAAARRLSWLERSQASYAAQRALDDPLVMAEYRLAGEAFAGPVTAAEPDRLDSSGRRRKLRPLITVTTEDSLRMDAGAMLVSPSRPSQQARVVSVTAAPPPSGPAAAAGQAPTGLVSAPSLRRTEVVLELSGGMGRALTAEPGRVPEPGERLCYTTLTDSYQPASSFPDREHTPWTHGGPPPRSLAREPTLTDHDTADDAMVIHP